jgi:hypothetical protein
LAIIHSFSIVTPVDKVNRAYLYENIQLLIDLLLQGIRGEIRLLSANDVRNNIPAISVVVYILPHIPDGELEMSAAFIIIRGDLVLRIRGYLGYLTAIRPPFMVSAASGKTSFWRMNFFDNRIVTV